MKARNAGWWGLGLGLGLVLAACRTDPYPSGGYLLEKKPEEKKPVPPPYVLDVASVLEFEEGKERQYPVQVSVPAPGTPVVSVSGLPAGATFSPQTMKLTWTPPFDAANDPKNQAVVTRSYPVQFTLSTSADVVTSISRTVTLVVQDTPQPFLVQFDGTTNLWEGKTFRRAVLIDSADFPKGPFEIAAQGTSGPISVESDKQNPKKFYVSYTPDFAEVTTRDPFYSGYGHYKVVPVKIRAFGPRGQSETSSDWTILDTRLEPKVSGPVKVEQGTEASFTLNAEDLNGEVVPTIKVTKPAFGTLTLTNVTDREGERGKANPMATAIARWDRIPPEKFGTTETLSFQVCVRGNNGDRLCKKHDVAVTLSAVAHALPLVERDTWPTGTTYYMKTLESASLRVNVRDGEGLSDAPKVVVEPPELRKEIQWERNRLLLTPKTPGTKPFTLVITSAYGAIRVEHFLLEALPATWNPVLLVGDSLEDPEVAKTLTVLGSAQVVNPSLQSLDDRMLALRTTLVVGTSALKKHPFALDSIEQASQRVKHLVLHTPLLEMLQGKAAAELAKAGIKLAGRLGTLPGPMPPVGQFNVFTWPGIGFTAPDLPLKVAGTLTPESASPLTMTLESDSPCVPLLDLSKENPAVRLTVAVRCFRSGGGRLLVAGFEWADLAAGPSDTQVPGKWWKEALGRSLTVEMP